MSIREVFGKNLKDARIRSGMTQEELAEKSLLSPNYIGMVERCERSIALENIGRVAKALGVEPHVLLMEAGNGND